jgi:hypothetical protein
MFFLIFIVSAITSKAERDKPEHHPPLQNALPMDQHYAI